MALQVEQGQALDIADLGADQRVENAVAVEEFPHSIAVAAGILRYVDVHQVVPIGLVGVLVFSQFSHGDSCGGCKQRSLVDAPDAEIDDFERPC